MQIAKECNKNQLNKKNPRIHLNNQQKTITAAKINLRSIQAKFMKEK